MEKLKQIEVLLNCIDKTAEEMLKNFPPKWQSGRQHFVREIKGQTVAIRRLFDLEVKGDET